MPKDNEQGNGKPTPRKIDKNSHLRLVVDDSEKQKSGFKAETPSKGATGEKPPAAPSKTRSARSASKTKWDGSDSSQEAQSKPSRASWEGMSQHLPVILMVVIVLLVAIIAFYGPAKERYVAGRENARLKAVLEQEQAYNAEMEGKVANLQTEQGIEDVARQELGLVKNGENAVKMTGLEEETETVHGKDALSDYELPRTWWSTLLDGIFGVDTSADPVEAESNSDQSRPSDHNGSASKTE